MLMHAAGLFYKNRSRTPHSRCFSSRLMISDMLHADASGASVIYYGGNPSVDSMVSGASKIVKE